MRRFAECEPLTDIIVDVCGGYYTVNELGLQVCAIFKLRVPGF